MSASFTYMTTICTTSTMDQQMVEFIQFVLLWWYEQNTLEVFSTGIIISSRISHILENHMSVAIWSPTIFINAVILVHRHKPNTIVVQLGKRWLISTWCQNFLRGKAAIWNCRLMLRHVTNSVTNSATPADSKEVCCQAAPEGSMHYWIDWNSCNHLTNTF